MKRLATLTLLALGAWMSLSAQWAKTTDLGSRPGICPLFAEVAAMERGIVRFVVLDALQARIDGTQPSYTDVTLDFEPDNDYFSAIVGAPDDGSGDTSRQMMQGKVWRPAGDGAPCLMATYLVDSSPQEEYRYLYFYQYNPLTRELKAVPRPFDPGYPDEELRYNLRSDGNIDVSRWGEPLCTLTPSGATFIAAP